MRTPVSTYRLQITEDFDLFEAARRLHYLHELGVDWVDGAYRGVAVPKSTPPDVRKKVSDMMDALNKDPELRKKMVDGGFEVIDITYEKMPAFMKERTQDYMGTAKLMGLAK